ncbi:tetratricopeptide repeat protein [Dokdonia sp. Asnod1-B02]|uniref:tetratricopeptide repeat protein n=1 Tax=Dokdonia sp. Asnod1-B02 TaxID=3160573 RepID=UPI00386E4F4D
MTIIFKLDDFIYSLFPQANNNLENLEKELIDFYTVNNIKPSVNFEEDVIKISIDGLRVGEENREYNELISLCESGKFEAAKIISLKLIEKHPNNSEYFRLNGQIESELGNQDEAINSLIDSLRWNPKNEWALLMMGNIFAKHFNDTQTAMKYYNQVLVIKPDDCITLNNIGVQLMQTNNKKDAVSYFEKALSVDKDYPNTYYALALVANQDGNSEKAFNLALTSLSKTNKSLNRELYQNSFNLAIESAKTIATETNNEKIISDYVSKLEYLSGRTIKIESDDSIDTAAKIEFAENYKRDHHLVKYKSDRLGIDHLILHELIHLELVLEAREKELNELFTTNESNKAKFKYSLENEIKKFQKRGVAQDNIESYINALFNGINSQLYNTPIDLFIEDRIYNTWKSIRPIQFLSLLSILQEGVEANTNKDIVKNTPKDILSTSKVFNLINAIHFKNLFNIDLLELFNHSKREMNQAQSFYSEFEEYRDDKKPGEEYEIIKHWGEDLNLDNFYSLIPETEYRKKTIDSVLQEISEDPLGINHSNPSNDRKMKKFLESNTNDEINKAVAMYMADALKYFGSIPVDDIKKIAFEIATIGTQGIDPSKDNYIIPSISNSYFSGYKTLAYYYVSWALSIPEMLPQLQLPFEKEYELATKFLKN